MTILVSNDDGIEAPGLRALVRVLGRRDEVVACAPEQPRSAVSNSITLHKPLRLSERREGRVRWWSVNGTPADAVKLALCKRLPRRPSLAVSGINLGLNTGSNILYSGTVAAALEAALHGVPSLAVSLEWSASPEFDRAARIALRLLGWARGRFAQPGTVLNINIPRARRLKGVLVTRQETTPYIDHFERRVDPRGRPYFWICGHPDPAYSDSVRGNGQGDPPTDAWACAHGYVSVTPLGRDMTLWTLAERMRAAPPPPL